MAEKISTDVSAVSPPRDDKNVLQKVATEGSGRRQSVAVNIVENPLQVSELEPNEYLLAL